MEDSGSDVTLVAYAYCDESERAAMERLLLTGEIEIKGLVQWSSNYTYLVNVRRGKRESLAIYKPQDGERPLWDFDAGSLCKREVAAYALSSFLRFPNIPLTVLREGPEGLGAVQQFIDHRRREHFFTLRAAHRAEMQKIAVFDALANNTDRKGGHVLLDKVGMVWAIDHGVTFHEDPKLRTVIWDYTNEPISAVLLKQLEALRVALRGGERICRELDALLSKEEIRALQSRLNELIKTCVYPSPSEEWPHIPWPPI